ncbi:hypothetical protein ACJX0J_021484 [Zea mays]
MKNIYLLIRLGKPQALTAYLLQAWIAAGLDVFRIHELSSALADYSAFFLVLSLIGIRNTLICSLFTNLYIKFSQSALEGSSLQAVSLSPKLYDQFTTNSKKTVQDT